MEKDDDIMQQGEDQNGSLAEVNPNSLPQVNDSLFSTSKVLKKKPKRQSEKIVKAQTLSSEHISPAQKS